MGFVTSFFLILLIVPLWRHSRGTENQLDGLGPLQVAWIAQHHAQSLNGLEEVFPPSTQNLRRAGLIEMDFRIRESKGKEDVGRTDDEKEG